MFYVPFFLCPFLSSCGRQYYHIINHQSGLFIYIDSDRFDLIDSSQGRQLQMQPSVLFFGAWNKLSHERALLAKQPSLDYRYAFHILYSMWHYTFKSLHKDNNKPQQQHLPQQRDHDHTETLKIRQKHHIPSYLKLIDASFITSYITMMHHSSGCCLLILAIHWVPNTERRYLSLGINF